MLDIATLRFPVLAFTPIGIMRYTLPQDLLKCSGREYKMGWYKDMEIVDTEGVCVVVRSASLVKPPTLLARLLSREREVQITGAERLATYDLAAVRDRVLEFLSIYPDMYESAGVYEEMAQKILDVQSLEEIIQLFAE